MKVLLEKPSATKSLSASQLLTTQRAKKSGLQLQDNRLPNIIQKKKRASFSDPVIQRAIVTTVVDDTHLSDDNTNKLTQVKKYMDESLSKNDSKIKTLFLNVALMKGTNPADTKLNNPGTAIIVRIASWFVRISSVGDICGMLSHEIGVHTLANSLMSDKQKEEEKEYEKQPFSVTVGMHTHTITPWDNGTTVRQRDHINVGRDKGNNMLPLRHSKAKRKIIKGKKQKRSGDDVNSLNARALQYAATTLRLGDAIEGDKTITQKEKDQRLHDLLNSFLFDYARIIATNDRGIRSFDKSALVAQVFNWYKNVIIVRYGKEHKWLLRKSMQPTASNWGLRAYLMGKAILALGTQARLGPVVSGIGHLIGGIGSGISKITPDFVKTGLRVADRVVGEVDNLIVPTVVSTGGWMKDRLVGLYGMVRGK